MPLVGKPTKKQVADTKPKDLPNETRLGTNVNGIWTYLSVPGLTLGVNVSEYTHSRGKACIDAKECSRLFASSSPRDRKQMKEFISANQKEKIGNIPKHWYLIEIRNLDTGRKFLAAGYKLEGPGLTIEQIKKIIGLK